MKRNGAWKKGKPIKEEQYTVLAVKGIESRKDDTRNDLSKKSQEITGRSDADWGSDSGLRLYDQQCCNNLRSKNQATVVWSATKAAYLALGAAGHESIWLGTVIDELGVPCEKRAMTIYKDNQAAIAMKTTHGKSVVHHPRSGDHFHQSLGDPDATVARWPHPRSSFALGLHTKNPLVRSSSTHDHARSCTRKSTPTAYGSLSLVRPIDRLSRVCIVSSRLPRLVDPTREELDLHRTQSEILPPILDATT